MTTGPRRALPMPDDPADVDDFVEDPSEQTLILPRRGIELPQSEADPSPDGTGFGVRAGRRVANPARLVDSVPPPPRGRDMQPVLPPLAAPRARRMADGEMAASSSSAPRRSATSPLEWDSPVEFVRPRRSATSPSEWDLPDTHLSPAEPVSPARAVGLVEAPVTAAAPAADVPPAVRDTVPAVVQPARTGSWRWGLLVGLLLCAALVAWLALNPRQHTDNPGSAPVKELAFLSPERAAPLGGVWSIAEDVRTIGDDSPVPTCFTGAPALLPKATASSLRSLRSDAQGTVLHRIDTYADVATAKDAFTARRGQLGMCTGTGRIVAAHALSGFGDEAVLVDVASQETTPRSHAVLLVRIGSGVEIVDAGVAGEVAPAPQLAQTMAPVVGDHCGPLTGSCSATTTLTKAVPPPGTEPGFLVAADVPRVTPGVGVWVPVAPSPTIDMKGTLCETTKLGEVPATRRFQRTLILTEDPAAGVYFGIDALVVEFGDEASANAFAGKLDADLTSCGSRMPTAAVDKIASTDGTLGTTTIKARTAVVVQKPAGTTARFRTGIVVAGKRVVYLVETPREDYDLSDAQWVEVTLRAGQRLGQWS